MKVIVLSGAPGAGKTECAARLIRLCPERSAWIDTDWLAGIHPWRVDEEFHALVGANLRACIENYRRWSARVLIVSGVVVHGGIYDELPPVVEGDTWQLFALQARPEVLARRILGDAKAQDADQRLQWLALNEEAARLPGCRAIDTSDLALAEVVERIAVAAGLLPAPAAAPPAEPVRASWVSLSVPEAMATASRALERAGTPPDIAGRVVAALVESERRGQPSHGLLRVPEYVAAIRDGVLDPAARPRVSGAAPARTVDGCNAFGVLAAAAVRDELVLLLEREPIAVVGLRAAGHLGRLAAIGEPLARRGYVVLGFVNYLGAGRKVLPWGAGEPRLATNPILLAFPAPEPVVIDMTTSTVAEGKVRVAALAGELVPEGWLVDDSWRPVRDPRRLYSNPPTAHLAPLGGGAGHKGFALALAVEILAGLVAGAGSVRPAAERGGNGGLFIAFRPTLAGTAAADYARELASMLAYVASGPPAPGRPPVRIPGRGKGNTGAAPTLAVLAEVWDQITALAT